MAMIPQESAREQPEILASDAERQQTLAKLKDSCVDGRLSLEEFGHRVELAHAARTRGDLSELTRDLPAVTASQAPHQRSTSTTLALLSSAERIGHWRMGQANRAIAVMGSCKLDLRSAVITAPVTTIGVQVIMGSVDVIVPEGLEVEMEAIAVAGSKSLHLSGPRPDPGAPVVRITGYVLMGAVNVRYRPSLKEQVRETLLGS